MNQTHAPVVSLSKEEINALPLCGYDGDVRLVVSQADMAAAIDTLRTEKVLGFDTETRPSFKKAESHPPSILQFAGANNVFVFQLSKVGSLQPLVPLLENPHILKVGVAPDMDMKHLHKLVWFRQAGLVDLFKIGSKAGLKQAGVRGLAAHMLGFRISKGAQCSNWSLPVLSHSQIRYAATDAWVCREIYLKMKDCGWV